MTASPAERRVVRGRTLAAALVAGAVLTAGAAAAQTQAPIPLTPSIVIPTPPRAESAPPTPAAAEPPAPIAARVEVQQLQALDVNSVGVLRPDNGGFGVDMWNGTGLGIVQRLMPHLPAATPSHAARNLARRLLLSEAVAPKGESWGDKTLLVLRVERLIAMGDLDGAKALLEAVPRPALSGPLVRARIDALLLSRQSKTACDEIGSARNGPDDVAFAKMRIFCQIQAGRTADAQLGIAMMREIGQSDAAFLALAEEMLGQPSAGAVSLAAPSPLLLAMVQATGKAFPPEAAATGQPAVLRAIVERPDANAALRLAAAEKAERLGLLDSKTLAELYAGTEFTAQERARPAPEVAADAAPRGRALLYQLATSQTTPAAQAEAIERALAAARMQGVYFSAARLYSGLIGAGEPAAQPAAFAGTALRSLLAAGKVTEAARWLPFADRQGGAAILARLAGLPGSEAPTPAILAGWRSGLRGLPAPQAERQAAIVLGLLSALGDDVSAEEWARLLGGAPLTSATVPQPALWHALSAAAAAGRRGETVLISLVALGDGGPGAAEPTTLHHIITALHRVGLVDEARTLAVEAAIAHGL